MTIWLGLDEIIDLHRLVMESTDEPSQGIRDVDLLESAVMRPQMAERDDGAGLIRQAVLLAIGISQNQPFVDGNKRSAYAAADVFLRINGYLYDGHPVAFGKQFEAVPERTDSLDAATDRFERWLRSNVHPYP